MLENLFKNMFSYYSV